MLFKVFYIALQLLVSNVQKQLVCVCRSRAPQLRTTRSPALTVCVRGAPGFLWTRSYHLQVKTVLLPLPVAVPLVSLLALLYWLAPLTRC